MLNFFKSKSSKKLSGSGSTDKLGKASGKNAPVQIVKNVPMNANLGAAGGDHPPSNARRGWALRSRPPLGVRPAAVD